MLFQTCAKLTFGLPDILVITVIARDRMSSVGSLFFRDRILGLAKICPQSEIAVICTKQLIYTFDLFIFLKI